MIVIKLKSTDLVLDQGEEKENENGLAGMMQVLRTKFELGLGLEVGRRGAGTGRGR